MKGDFSRLTFDPTKQYTRVLMQQGRVQIDADWNEQTAILLHYLRTLGADLIGPFGGPANPDGTPGDGFRLGVRRNADGTPMTGDFALLAGRYYVDGILCENPQDWIYSQTPGNPLPGKLDAGAAYLLYLDVWERHVTYLQDEILREVALGGADTATRAQVVWQVRDLKADKGATDFSCQAARRAWAGWVEQWQSAQRGRLKAQARPGTPDDTDPCLASPDARYRGENQLYRVEIHTGGAAGAATFKWSSDNGSIVYPIRGALEKGSGTTTVTLERLGLDDKSDLMQGDWVEIADNQEDLRDGIDPLLQVSTVEPDKILVTLKGVPVSNIGDDKSPLLLRRWDHRRSTSKTKPSASGVFPVKEGEWLDLENGVQIFFAPADKGAETYRSGDYWLIPARVATGDVEWPGPANDPAALPPFGVRHHYAPLGIVTLPVDAPAVLTDCRTTFGCRATRLDTGTADWQLVAVDPPSIGGTVPRTADLVTALGQGWATLPGAWWISASPKATGTTGTYTYETRFNLCPCFHSAGLSLSMLVAKSATVFLNKQQIGARSGPDAFKGDPTVIEKADQGLFVAGPNVLRVVVTASEGPPAFVLSGIVDTDGSSCC
jgi:hypothetical protein